MRFFLTWLTRLFTRMRNRASTRSRIFWLAAVLMLVLFQFLIIEKEGVLRNGDTLLLRLAPVDPRSLMQGDYMRLRYAIERDIPWNLASETEGCLVVRPGEHNEAFFVRFHANEHLEPGEYLVRYAPGSTWPRERIRPDSFFFQEGHTSFYDKAHFGVFRCRGDAPCLLTGLADETGMMIVPATASVEE